MNENKEILIRYEYNSYGEVTITKGSNISISKENPFRYKCYYYDEETKLYYLITRYYDSEIGRFISPDSIEYLDAESINGLNLYCYCMNNPIMYVDPDGHMPEWGWWVLGGVVVIACLATTIITARGFTAGGVAIYSAMCGIAYGS